MSLRFAKLTRNAVRALSIGQGISEHGIVAKRLPTGDVRYSINIMVDGQRIHRVIGRASEGVTREQAEKAIETLRTKAREDRLNLPKGRKRHRAFDESAKSYLANMSECNGGDLANKTRHLNDRLIPFFGSKRIDAISALEIAKYRSQRLNTVKSATINRELATLSHCLNRFVEWGWLSRDNKPVIIKDSEDRKQITVLSDVDCAALIDAAKHDADDRMLLFVCFGLFAAMRHSEIVATRYEQVDHATRRLFIPTAKAGSREQPLTQGLIDLIKADSQSKDITEGWIFPAHPTAKTDAARRSHRSSMEYGFKRVVERAGLDPARITPHVMRHTAITRLVKAGVDLPTIQKVSGHKTLQMVLRNTHVHGPHIDRAMTNLELA